MGYKFNLNTGLNQYRKSNLDLRLWLPDKQNTSAYRQTWQNSLTLNPSVFTVGPVLFSQNTKPIHSHQELPLDVTIPVLGGWVILPDRISIVQQATAAAEVPEEWSSTKSFHCLISPPQVSASQDAYIYASEMALRFYKSSLACFTGFLPPPVYCLSLSLPPSLSLSPFSLFLLLSFLSAVGTGSLHSIKQTLWPLTFIWHFIWLWQTSSSWIIT